MARSYKFAIVRLSPNDARDERLNIGIVVFSDSRVDVRRAKRIDKVRAISAAVEPETISQLLSNLTALDDTLRDSGVEDVGARHAQMVELGPISLSSLGTFVSETAADYEARVASILKAMVDVEPAGRVRREKRSKLLTQVKRQFKIERVMAEKDEDLSSHRIIPSFELDDGLVADLVLRNGAMHVVETVDASGGEESIRKAVSEVGIAALVFERARMRFGKTHTKGKLVYSASPALERIAMPSLQAAEHQGAQLVNWDSADDRAKFIQSLTMLATPIPTKRKKTKFVSGANPKLFE
jgi:Protein of unknown function (DUF3037)